jgi:hypothetical protein
MSTAFIHVARESKTILVPYPYNSKRNDHVVQIDLATGLQVRSFEGTFRGYISGESLLVIDVPGTEISRYISLAGDVLSAPVEITDIVGTGWIPIIAMLNAVARGVKHPATQTISELLSLVSRDEGVFDRPATSSGLVLPIHLLPKLSWRINSDHQHR